MTTFVYLIGANYSGTTLLTFLLNTHPDIATVGELKGATKDPATHPCSCGKSIGACPFWSSVLERLHQRGVPFRHEDVWSQCGFRIPDAPFLNRVAQHRLRSWPLELARSVVLGVAPAARRALRRVGSTNQAFVETVAEMTGCKVFLDSSKDPTRLMFLRKTQPFPLKVIHMFRDGRGVTNSAIKRKGVSAEAAALEWVTREHEIRRFCRRLSPEQRMEIRYEDLCHDPEANLSRIYAFLGLAASDGHLSFRSAEHHILGNAMRLQGSAEIRHDTKWQTELTPAGLADFERVGGRLNTWLGYAPTPEHHVTAETMA